MSQQLHPLKKRFYALILKDALPEAITKGQLRNFYQQALASGFLNDNALNALQKFCYSSQNKEKLDPDCFTNIYNFLRNEHQNSLKNPLDEMVLDIILRYVEHKTNSASPIYLSSGTGSIATPGTPENTSTENLSQNGSVRKFLVSLVVHLGKLHISFKILIFALILFLIIKSITLLSGLFSPFLYSTSNRPGTETPVYEKIPGRDEKDFKGKIIRVDNEEVVGEIIPATKNTEEDIHQDTSRPKKQIHASVKTGSASIAKGIYLNGQYSEKLTSVLRKYAGALTGHNGAAEIKGRAKRSCRPSSINKNLYVCRLSITYKIQSPGGKIKEDNDNITASGFTEEEAWENAIKKWQLILEQKSKQ